jgi:hypothetical protein
MWIISSNPLWFLLIDFCLIKRLSLWCMHMTYGCWRKFVPSLKTISWRFAWSGLLWTLVHNWITRIHLFKNHQRHFSHMFIDSTFSQILVWPDFYLFLVDSYSFCHLFHERSNSWGPWFPWCFSSLAFLLSWLRKVSILRLRTSFTTTLIWP